LSEAAQLGFDGVHLVEDRPRPPGEDEPGRRQPHAPTGPFEQLGARLVLQHRELLRHARRAEVRGLRHRPHGTQRVELAEQAQAPRVERHAVQYLRTASVEL
jgi:hypothetical protein